MNPTDFRDVREQIATSAEVPDLDIIYRFGNRRRSTVRSGALLAVVAFAVVAALIGVNLLVTRPPVPIGPGPLPSPVHGSLRGAAFDLKQPTDIRQLSATSPFQSYAVLKSNGSTVLAHTFDAGRSWQAWQVPVPIGDFQAIWPYPGQTLLGIAKAGGKVSGYLSRDGGESWTPMPADGPPVKSVPAGWDLVSYGQPSDGGDLLQATQYALDPATNVPHRLEQPPPASGGRLSRLGVVTATDGSLWSLGATGGLKFPVISRDRGASWHGVQQAAPAYDVALDQSAGHLTNPTGEAFFPTAWVDGFDTLDGKTGYATVEVWREGRTTTATRIYVTRDGGKSWTFAPQDRPRFLSAILVTPDGSLLAVDHTDNIAQATSIDGQLVISHDDGRTFQAVAGVGQVRLLSRAPSGEPLVYSAAGANYWPMSSRDGVHWTRTATPPNAQWP